jgi:hypothetical protein
MAAITIPGLGMGAVAPAAPAVRCSASVYRRRRVVALALVIVAGLVFVLGVQPAGGWVLGVLGGGPLTASEAGSSATAAVSTGPAEVHVRMQPVSRATYVVAPGDTLWSIARRLQPAGDVRPVVDALAAVRHGRPLQPGEAIVMPAVLTP